MLRPGCFEEIIYVAVPDEKVRRQILVIHTEKMPRGEGVDLDDLARRTPRFTGADLEDLVRRAGLTALRQDNMVTAVPGDHFEAALKETRASVTPEMEEAYREMPSTLKQEAMQARLGFIIRGM